MKFRSRPQTIEAVQWTGDNADDAVAFGTTGELGGPHCVRLSPTDGLVLFAGKDGAQGWVPVPVGHWIVRNPGDYTDFWPVDPDYFASKYEPTD